jgi:CheY-like chemotaxis protein
MKRIVVVDDQPLLGNIYRSKFVAAGYRVDVAVDGEQAIEMIQHEKPDLVLLDLMLPKIDGLEVLRRLRADSAFRVLPIIVFSASARPGMVEDAWSAGASMVLSKTSTSPKEILELVRQTLANQPNEPTTTPETAAAGTADAKPTIVHFDPNPDLQALIALLLRRAGYRVNPARTEREVIESGEGSGTGFFLISGISGSCTSLVQQCASKFPKRLVVAYSTIASPGQQSEVLGAGASLFIRTPEELLNIAEALTTLATNRR